MCIAIEELPDELLLHIIRHTNELADWPQCAAVSQLWARLVASNRTELHFPPWAPIEQVTHVLLAGLRSTQPLRKICMHLDNPTFWPGRSASLKALHHLVGTSSTSLSSLELSGREPFSLTPLAPIVEALANEPSLALDCLDLSWAEPPPGAVLSALLDRVAASPTVLKVLRIKGCATLDEAIFKARVAPLVPHLTELSLAGCLAISGGVVAEVVSSGAALTSLDLSLLRLSPTALCRCLAQPQLRHSLRRLGLSGYTSLPASSIAYALIVCERLTDVNFSASLLTDDALGEAAAVMPTHLAALQRVRISECSSVTCIGLAALCSLAGGNLRHLDIGGPFSSLRDDAAATLAAHSTSLRTLSFGCCRLSAAGMRALAPLVANLEQLDLSGSADLERDALAQILRRMGPGCGARLRVLTLRGCADAVSDELLAGFIPRAHGLQQLNIAGCHKLTDLSARLIASARARALLRLRQVDISGCRRLTKRGRKELSRAIPVLVNDDSFVNDDDKLCRESCELHADGTVTEVIMRQLGELELCL